MYYIYGLKRNKKNNSVCGRIGNKTSYDGPGHYMLLGNTLRNTIDSEIEKLN